MIAKAIRRDAHASAARVAATYLLIAGLYIVASDRMLEWITQDAAALTRLQTFKGIGFVLATAGLVYAMVFWQVRRLLRVEAAERQYREQVRRAFEDSVIGMALLSLDGRIQRVNRVYGEMLGRSAGSLQNVDVLDLTHPEDRPFRAEVLRRLREGEPINGPQEIRYLHADGRTVWILANTTLARDADDRPMYFISQLVDITLRREAELKLRHQESQLAHASRLITLGQMASGLAHDLSQPISTIMQYAETTLDLMEKGRTDQTQAIIGALRDVIGQAELTREIVNRLRTLARKRTPRREDVDLNDMIRRTLRLLSPEAERRHVRVRLDLGRDLPPLHADPVELQQLLINLVNNAMEALADTPADARQLKVATRLDDDQGRVVMSVEDSGPGPDAQVADRMFEAFVTSKPHGVGLGLAICRAISRDHGGRLWHERGDGITTFCVEWPVQETAHV